MANKKKIDAIFKLMEYFLIKKEICSYDKEILAEFGCSDKTLERYLIEIENYYEHIITIKKSRKKIWKLVSVSNILEEFIKNSQDISQLFLMAQEFDPEILKELEKGTLSKIAKRDESIFLFKNSIMEEMKSQKTKKIFEKLKVAIVNNEYRDINNLKDVKCLKLLFIDNNWYIAVVDLGNKLLLIRLSFIKEIKYASSGKQTYQTKDIQSYLDFLYTAQNSLTLYDTKSKTATIKATSAIAKYFEKDMKLFLSTQKFLKHCDDGGIIFTLDYTQELEILPFIQRWLPELIVLEPRSLKDSYTKKLKLTLNAHK